MVPLAQRQDRLGDSVVSVASVMMTLANYPESKFARDCYYPSDVEFPLADLTYGPVMENPLPYRVGLRCYAYPLVVFSLWCLLRIANEFINRAQPVVLSLCLRPF